MKEKLLRSLNSSDLTQEEFESAAHVVASLGAAQIGNRRHLSVGAMLLHVRAGQARFLPRVIALTTLYVSSRAKRERWAGVTIERAGIIAREAIDRSLHPHCEVCNGVGKLGELGSVIVLCSKQAGGCGGTGKRPEHWKGWMERVKDVIAAIESWEGYAAGGTRYQARSG
jgi:hypothetical protein